MRIKTTHMAGDVVEIVCDAGHVATDVLAAVVDARVLETEEGDFDELTGAQRHVLRVLGGDAELEEVELVDVLEECSGVSEDLARRIAADANGAVLANELLNSCQVKRAYYSMLKRSLGIGS